MSILFWIRNIKNTWRTEWPHDFLIAEDFDNKIWDKKLKSEDIKLPPQPHGSDDPGLSYELEL
jgi:hypothetical protein